MFLGGDAAGRRCLVLESGAVAADSERPPGGLSYLADSPVDEFSVAGPVSPPAAQAALLRLRERLNAVASPAKDAAGQPAGLAGPRFIGGYAGFLGYELGAALEGVGPAAADDINLPALRFALYDAVACFDHRRGQWELSALLLDSERRARQRLDELESRLLSRSAGQVWAGPSAGRSGGETSGWLGSAEAGMTRRQYEHAVERALEYIAAGDIYQVNIAQRFTWKAAGGAIDPGALFAAIRAGHPAEYSAFLAWPDRGGRPAALCSASPELFLAVDAGHVVTRPIKGTRPRVAGAVDELLASEKDAAELAMIVDLERNDLGRVCRFGSVRVTAPRAVQTLPHVHHTFATVEGQLADGRDIIDLLLAAFPGGSITGAPKIRAMQIIAELEPTVRSAYTGAIGYLGADGRAMLNIAIRTAIVSEGATCLHVGAGIVADSVAAAEYEETIAKAEGLAQAIAGVSAGPQRLRK